MLPSQSQANQSTYGQSTLGQWPLTSHARSETVEEEDEKEDDAVQPEPSNDVPVLDSTSRGPSEMEYEPGDATRVESGESVENTVRHATKPLGTEELDDSEGDTTLYPISKPNDSPTPKLKTPANHNMFNTLSSGSLFGP